jgi:hypothetical protein
MYKKYKTIFKLNKFYIKLNQIIYMTSRLVNDINKYEFMILYGL